MSAPERIFARLDTATVYMDGSSPLVARTREFRDSVEYVRADGNSFDALRDAFLRGASWRKRNGFSEGEAEEYIWKAAIDEAKAAAQADYDQRIRSALVSTPAPGLVEALREDRPLSTPTPRSGTDAAWEQIAKLFRRHGLAEPPTRLRDELVTFAVWAWYGQKLDAALSSITETGGAKG